VLGMMDSIDEFFDHTGIEIQAGRGFRLTALI
jgi:hypothetical protein